MSNNTSKNVDRLAEFNSFVAKECFSKTRTSVYNKDRYDLLRWYLQQKRLPRSQREQRDLKESTKRGLRDAQKHFCLLTSPQYHLVDAIVEKPEQVSF